jgi:hypothetical protein
LTLKSAAADVALRKIDDLGLLAIAVFERVVAEEDGVRGRFSAEPLSAYNAMACTASPTPLCAGSGSSTK